MPVHAGSKRDRLLRLWLPEDADEGAASRERAAAGEDEAASTSRAADSCEVMKLCLIKDAAEHGDHYINFKTDYNDNDKITKIVKTTRIKIMILITKTMIMIRTLLLMIIIKA